MLAPHKSLTGYDASDQEVRNVAPGQESTSAVNLDQLTAAIQAGPTEGDGIEYVLTVPPDYDYTKGDPLTLSVPASTGNHDLYIGGMRQWRDAYTVQGTVITLPADLLLGFFDMVAFVYRPA